MVVLPSSNPFMVVFILYQVDFCKGWVKLKVYFLLTSTSVVPSCFLFAEIWNVTQGLFFPSGKT